MARNLNGTSDFLKNTSFSVVAADDITVFFWNFALTPAQNSFFFVIGGSADDDRLLCLAPWSNETLYWDYGNATAGDGRLSTSYGAYMNKWTAVGLGAASTPIMKIYLDGAQVATQNSRGTPTTVTPLRIGTFNETSEFHKGRLAEFTIWNAFLDAAEHAALGKGISPLLIRPGSLLFHAPLIGLASPEIERIGSFNLTLTGTTQFAHPKIIYPHRRGIRRFTTAAAGGGGERPLVLSRMDGIGSGNRFLGNL